MPFSAASYLFHINWSLFIYYSIHWFTLSISLWYFVASGGNLVKRSLKDTIKCFEDSKFYRNPERPTHKMWTNSECSKYYLCLDGEVFEFKCSVGLLFDVMRQICDFKQNVDNCDVTAGLFFLKLCLCEINTCCHVMCVFFRCCSFVFRKTHTCRFASHLAFGFQANAKHGSHLILFICINTHFNFWF